MDSTLDTGLVNTQATDETDTDLPIHQINPLSLMTALTHNEQVDDNQENLLESTIKNCSQSQTTSCDKSSDQQKPTDIISSLNPINQRTIAAWVQSTTVLESLTGSIERSPSLPSTLIEATSDRSRRDSTVSTVYDQPQSQQPSNLVDPSSSSNLSAHYQAFTLDVQRSFSFPMSNFHDNMSESMPIAEESDGDFQNKFLPVPESEESEIDKQGKPSPSMEDSISFQSRSPITAPRNKRTSNVSFYTSVSFESHVKGRPFHRRQRHNSWTHHKHRTPPSLHLPNTSSNPWKHISPANQNRLNLSRNTSSHLGQSSQTNPSSSLSDNVFQSISISNSSSVSRRLPLNSQSPGNLQFSSIPSSISDRLTSNISDASGLSGIESTNLRTSPSEARQASTIHEQHSFDGGKFSLSPYRSRPDPSSSHSSRTASTEYLPTSSSEDDLQGYFDEPHAFYRLKPTATTPKDQRVHALNQLLLLLEKRQTINPRVNLTHRHPSPAFPATQGSSRSNNTPHATSQVDSDHTINSKHPGQLYSSSSDTSHQVHSLPTHLFNSQSPSSPQGLLARLNPLIHSEMTVRTIQSDSSLTGSLINSRVTPTTTSLSASIQLPRATTAMSVGSGQRKRMVGHHRRNLSGLAAVARDRKNSFTRSATTKLDEQPTTNASTQQQTVPLKRDIKSILNEHLSMINNVLLHYSCNASIQYPSNNSSLRDFLYRHLSELSLENPMKQRCSKIETKAFIDSITSYHMNRSHHYKYLLDNIRNLLKSNRDPVRLSTCSSETEDDRAKVFSSTILFNSAMKPNSLDDIQAFREHPLRVFSTLSEDYVRDCEQTEKDLTKKLFDIADKQHILYCLKHVNSGHTDERLSLFHRRLDAIFVWYNLYYELTISVKKLSGLLRCDDCDDWPKLHFRSLATERERKAKRADEDDDDDDDDDDWSSEESDDAENDEVIEENDEENEIVPVEGQIEFIDDEREILPKIDWSDELLDQFPNLKIQDETTTLTDGKSPKLDKTACYRNFVYYMDKRSYQVKYDGLARTLIERVAPVLAKTRLALLQTFDRRQIKIEQILAGLSASDFQSDNRPNDLSKSNPNPNDIDDALVDTDNPVDKDNSIDTNTNELTIESWLYQVLKSCPTVKTICTHKDEILKQNWLELHEQLGLPSLLPMYFFLINVLLDVMNECLSQANKPYVNNETTEIDAICRQQLVREAKSVLRDALATRLYSVRMMEQFISNRKISDELADFDRKIVDHYRHYKHFLSTVSINRTYESHDDSQRAAARNRNTEYYFYVDEETSELIKEYYFARDLTLTLGNRELIHELGIQFNDLVKGILARLKEELSETTESYYQTFAADTSNTSAASDGMFSADAVSDNNRNPFFSTSMSVPSDFIHRESSLCDASASFSEQKKCEIIFSTREFRRSFDTIKQRTIRICSLAKTLLQDFSIAAEFKCPNYSDLWNQLRHRSYAQVKIHLESSNSDEFDYLYLFVPRWLSKDKNQVEKLLNTICSQQLSRDELRKSSKDVLQPSFMVFLPRKPLMSSNPSWDGDVIRIRANEAVQLALNSTELASLHLVVSRSDHWERAVKIFQDDVGTMLNNQLITRLARDEDLRTTFDQLSDCIIALCQQMTHLVRILNAIWDQESIKIFLTEIVKFDERQLRTIESKLLDLVLYVYNSGFELFRLLYELLPSSSKIDSKIIKIFVSTMNEFFCEWCKCVTKKFRQISTSQARTVKYKVIRPRWFRPGMIFLGFLATSPHLQLLNEDDYRKLMTEIPAALKALRGNTLNNPDSPNSKTRSNSFSLPTTTNMATRQMSRPSGGHRRIDSAGGTHDLFHAIPMTPSKRIELSIEKREKDLEQKLRDRKQIGRIYDNTNAMTASGTTVDPVISLKTRSIDFPWRRGNRLGQGGAGVAFRAINCSNGSIVCMKEIQLSSIASRSLPSTYPEKLRRIAEEIDMIMSINHPNIVRYFGIEKYKRTIYICMEYCLSTVNEFLADIRAFQKRAHSRKSISGVLTDSSDQDDDASSDDIRIAPSFNVNELVRGFVKQLLQALLALHEHCIVHCDVKGDNIFIANEDGHYIVKLGDFNLSHRLELESPNGSDSLSTQFGTLYFKPPELEYVYQSDIWALGCTVIEMLTGKLPWTNVTRPHEERIYIQNQLAAKKGPPIPDELKEQKEAYEFIQLCLIPDPIQRPLAKTLLDHPYPRVRTDS